MVLTVAAGLLVAMPRAGDGQSSATLRITVTLADADGRPLPMPRHALLVSDDPPTASPRRVVTALDGAASLRLVPGTYIVESDRPLSFQGQQYEWRQMIKVAPSGETMLALGPENAEASAIADAPAAAAAGDRSSSYVDVLWQDSVAALWTPTTRVSGFVVDGRGLVATSRSALGTATSAEVQLTPTVKVRGRVIASDQANDAAVLWIDPAALGAIKPVPLGCGQPLKPLTNGQEVAALGVPSGRPQSLSVGELTRVTSRTMLADLRLPAGSAGGPVFAGTDVVGLTSLVGEKEGADPDDARVVRVDAVCDVVAAAVTALATAKPPDPARLPMEPPRTIPEAALEAGMKKRAGSLNPYQVASAGFDVGFVTPVSAFAGLRGTTDFANWTEYVGDAPLVLMLRVTPKFEENFWTKVARGVAMTKGIALPPIKRFVSGFDRMRVLCGGAEVTPIHPFLLERRISESDAVREGLYVFDPDAIGPHCGTVTLELFSEKTPTLADAVTVDPKILEQVWQDFAPFRPIR